MLYANNMQLRMCIGILELGFGAWNEVKHIGGVLKNVAIRFLCRMFASLTWVVCI
jgi:hypothetical protein